MKYQLIIATITSADGMLAMRFDPNFSQLSQQLAVLKTMITAAHEKGMTDFSTVYQQWQNDHGAQLASLYSSYSSYKEVVRLLSKAFLPSETVQSLTPLCPVASSATVYTSFLANNANDLRQHLLPSEDLIERESAQRVINKRFPAVTRAPSTWINKPGPF